MKIIITGGFGYIGSNIARRLIQKGHEVIIFDFADKPLHLSDLNCESIKCDITEFEKLSKIEFNSIDAVLHLAAQSSGPNSIKIPKKI